jgi:hypothetical protein
MPGDIHARSGTLECHVRVRPSQPLKLDNLAQSAVTSCVPVRRDQRLLREAFAAGGGGDGRREGIAVRSMAPSVRAKDFPAVEGERWIG